MNHDEGPPHHWDCRVPDGRECKSYRDGGSCVCRCHEDTRPAVPEALDLDAVLDIIATTPTLGLRDAMVFQDRVHRRVAALRPAVPEARAWNIDANGVPRSPEWWSGYEAGLRARPAVPEALDVSRTEADVLDYPNHD